MPSAFLTTYRPILRLFQAPSQVADGPGLRALIGLPVRVGIRSRIWQYRWAITLAQKESRPQAGGGLICLF